MDKNRLYRSQSNYMIGGVCSGLANYVGMDVTIVRILFLIFTLMSGTGVLIYLILWAIMPREDQTGMPEGRTNLDAEGLSQRARMMGDELREVIQKPNPDALKFIGIALIVMGGLFFLQNFGFAVRWLRSDVIWPLILIGGGAFMLWKTFKKENK